MKSVHKLLFASLAVGMAFGLVSAVQAYDSPRPTAPIYGVQLPDGYRDWSFIAPAQEAAPLDELRVVVGNPKAMRAYRESQRPFPDGTVLVKLAWKHEQSPDFALASVPGAATTVQVMVKDSRKYASTPVRVGGATDASSTGSPWMRPNTRPAMHVTRPV